MKPRVAIVIADYNPSWPSHDEQEKQTILKMLGAQILVIEHIGSTAVRGLAAKPIVDIIATVRDRQTADSSLPALAAVGYLDVTAQGDHAEWFYCLGKRLNDTTYCHLHLVKADSDFFARHLLFRDALLADAGLARRYETLKRELAAKFGADREGYTNAKTVFIESALTTAGKRRK